MNSKFIIAAFFACLATSFASSQDVGARIDCMHRARVAQGRIFEGKIREVIEQLRQFLKKGSEGVPPLDPLNVKDYHLAVDHDLVKLNSNWTAVSSGLAGFEITQLSLNLIGLKLKFKVHFPRVTGSGDYKVDLTSSLLPERIFGKGHFDVSAGGFTVAGNGKVSTKLVHGKMVPQIKSLQVDPVLKEFALSMTGFMNDEDLSKEISERLTNNLPSMIQENKAKINQIISDVIPYVNDYLAGNSVAYGVEPISC